MVRSFLRFGLVSSLVLSSVAFASGCEDDPAKGKTAATVGSAVPVEAPKPAASAVASAGAAIGSAVAGAGSAAGSAIAAAGTAASAAMVVAGTPYTINETNSKVGFVGAKITGKHVGSFQKFAGTIDLVGGKAETSKVTIDIDMASLKTDQEKLDTHLKSKDFFAVDTFPKAHFVSTSIVAGGANGATHTITGNLELHGVTKSIGFPAKISIAADGVTATAEFTINRKDFGILYPGKVDDLIKDDVVITLTIKGTKAN